MEFTILLAALILVCILNGEALYIVFSGQRVARPTIPRDIQVLGNGDPLRYAVMGDSTSISQGSRYEHGYAFSSARHMAKNHTVAFLNTGVSGATAKTMQRQLKSVVAFQPDIVLLAIGANDATHFTRGSVIKTSINAIIRSLRSQNPATIIIVTGSPAMDSVSRFPFLSKLLMRLRTYQVNRVFEQLIAEHNLIHAPIAKETRKAFLKDPTLTAVDKFHPNARGYALWIPIINTAIDTALRLFETRSKDIPRKD